MHQEARDHATRRSSTLGTPRGSFGSSGWITDHSKSFRPKRAISSSGNKQVESAFGQLGHPVYEFVLHGFLRQLEREIRGKVRRAFRIHGRRTSRRLAADAVVMTPKAVVMVAAYVHANGADVGADDAGIRRRRAQQTQREH